MKRTATLIVLTIALAGGGTAAADALHATGGLALEGYDPVAYFTEGEPVEGSPEIAMEWMGATWRFSSETNRDAFAADPERYAPAYGGYCAWAAAEGYAAPGDPQFWAIEDGRLFVNFSRGVQRRWDRDRNGHIERADRNWPGIAAGLKD